MTDNPGSGGYGGPNPIGGDPWNVPYQGPTWNQPTPARPDDATTWGAYTPPQQPQAPGQPPQMAGALPYVTPPPQFMGGPGFGGPMPPQRNRTALWVTIGAGTAVVLVLAIVGSLLLFGGSGKKGSAGDMVTAYLEALAAGDAEAALSFSADEPASKELLTDEILQQQVEEMPISNIRILGDDSSAGAGVGTVHVTVNFGDRLSDTTLMVKYVDGEWKLDNAAVRMDNTSTGGGFVGASSTLTAFGKPVGDAVFYVFPGYIEWGTDNKNIEVTSGEPLLLDSLSVGSYGSLAGVQYGLSDEGDEAVRTALGDAIDVCAQSTSMQPADCPQYIFQYDGIDGTVKWTAPSADDATITFNDYDMSARFDLEGDWGYTVRIRDGGTESGTASTFLYGSVDLTQDPIEISLK